LVAHQTKHRQQLLLGELVFAEARAVGGKTCVATCSATRAKGRSPTSAIVPPAPSENTLAPCLSTPRNTNCVEDVNRASVDSKEDTMDKMLQDSAILVSVSSKGSCAKGEQYQQKNAKLEIGVLGLNHTFTQQLLSARGTLASIWKSGENRARAAWECALTWPQCGW
jgi:hypothetical protein